MVVSVYMEVRILDSKIYNYIKTHEVQFIGKNLHLFYYVLMVIQYLL